jgi:hypothetical protein
MAILLPTHAYKYLYTVILNEVKDLKYPEKQDSSLCSE